MPDYQYLTFTLNPYRTIPDTSLQIKIADTLKIMPNGK